MKKKLRKNWYLGLFSLFSFYGIVGIAEKEWSLLLWFSWIVWAIYFIPVNKDKKY